jgi:hypothetical protein
MVSWWALIIGGILVAPFAYDIIKGQPIGTSLKGIGQSIGEVGKGIQTFISSLLSPQIRPALVPELGLRIGIGGLSLPTTTTTTSTAPSIQLLTTPSFGGNVNPTIEEAPKYDFGPYLITNPYQLRAA